MKPFLMGFLFLFCFVSSAASEQRLSFIEVALDVETRQADRKLQDILYQRAGVTFAPEELEYGTVINRLTRWKPEEGFFLARTTPYVYVAAEMLGADLEILATYVSATTARTTYHAYFVVPRKYFREEPALLDLIRFLGQKPDRVRFIYHSRFSTSSFFLPSLYFRTNKVFHMPESSESLIAIASEQIPENSSTRLVQRVALGEADLAAVWDGIKAKFESSGGGADYEKYGKQVYFIQLPTAIPNDLLVCSKALDPQIKERLRDVIGRMGPEEIGIGDFRTWKSINEATEARSALADLRWLAQENVHPATVDIRLRPGAGAGPESTALVESARQAVRLSGTEFVLFDADFHEHIDFVWTLEPIHDGAVLLRSAVPGAEIEDQVFRLSFRDSEDLTKRIVSLMQSRMHRIRYVWPYCWDPPIVICDMPFSIAAGDIVKVQKIAWLDPERNKFRAGPLFNARIGYSGFFRYELNPEDFSRSGDITELDALSNTSYRVIMIRSSDENPLFHYLTVILLALLLVAAGAGGYDILRSRRMMTPDSRPEDE